MLRNIPSPIYAILLLVLCTSPASGVQDGTPVPREGGWQIDATLEKWGQFQDQEQVIFIVNTCGDEITMHHGRLDGGSLLLTWNGRQYFGTGTWDGGDGTIELTLKAVTETEMVGDAQLIMPGMTQDWDLKVHHHSEPAGPNAGYATLMEQSTFEETKGVFVSEFVTSRLLLGAFNPNDATLLPNHITALNNLFTQPEPTPGALCETLEPSEFHLVQGYIDNELERRIQTAEQRARNTREFIVRRAGGITENPIEAKAGAARTAPRGSGTCRRAAVVTYTTERRFAEPWTRADTDRFLRKWFQQAKAVEREAEYNWSQDRLKAKGAYCLARDLVEMLEEGHCEPPEGHPAYRALVGQPGERRNGEITHSYLGPETEIPAAYEMLYTIGPGDVGTVKALPSNTGFAREQDKAAREQDPYFHYTHKTCDSGAKRAADAIEKDIFGDVTRWETLDR